MGNPGKPESLRHSRGPGMAQAAGRRRSMIAAAPYSRKAVATSHIQFCVETPNTVHSATSQSAIGGYANFRLRQRRRAAMPPP